MHSEGTSETPNCAREGVARIREDDQEDCEVKDRLSRDTEPEDHGDLHFRCISIPSHPPQ